MVERILRASCFYPIPHLFINNDMPEQQSRAMDSDRDSSWPFTDFSIQESSGYSATGELGHSDRMMFYSRRLKSREKWGHTDTQKKKKSLRDRAQSQVIKHQRNPRALNVALLSKYKTGRLHLTKSLADSSGGSPYDNRQSLDRATFSLRL